MVFYHDASPDDHYRLTDSGGANFDAETLLFDVDGRHLSFSSDFLLSMLMKHLILTTSYLATVVILLVQINVCIFRYLIRSEIIISLASYLHLPSTSFRCTQFDERSTSSCRKQDVSHLIWYFQTWLLWRLPYSVLPFWHVVLTRRSDTYLPNENWLLNGTTARASRQYIF